MLTNIISRNASNSNFVEMVAIMIMVIMMMLMMVIMALENLSRVQKMVYIRGFMAVKNYTCNSDDYNGIDA